MDPSLRLKAAGIICRQCSSMEGGEQHHLFRVVDASGRIRVLKIARTDRPFGDPWEPERGFREGLLAEAQATRLLRGVAAPREYITLEGEPPAVLMEHIQGESGERLWRRNKLRSDGLRRVCFAMGRTLAGVHKVKRPADPGGCGLRGRGGRGTRRVPGP